MKNTITLFLLTLSLLSFGQVSFQKSYGDSGDEIGYSITELADSSFAVAGVTTSFSTDKDIIVVKIAHEGGVIWTRSIRGTKIDVGRKIMATKDGGMVIVGSTASFGSGRRDVFVLKLDKKGDTEWAKVYGGEHNEYAFAVRPTTDGGYIIGGETSSFGVRASDILLFKTDAEGNVEWSATLGGKHVEYAFDVIEQTDGYLVGFESNSWGRGGRDVGLFKITKKGKYKWLYSYGGPKEDNISGLLALPDGTIAMSGMTASFGHGSLDGFFLKCGKSGKLLFARTYGDKGADVFQGMMKVKDGYVFCGFTNSYNDNLLAEDLLLAKINEKGHMKWGKTYGGTFSDIGLAMVQSTKGELVVVGDTKSFSGRSDKDIYIVKNKNSAGLSTCEQGRIQLIGQKAEFTSNSYQPTVKMITLKVSDADFKNTPQLLPDLNICIDGEQIIDERKEQLENSK